MFIIIYELTLVLILIQKYLFYWLQICSHFFLWKGCSTFGVFGEKCDKPCPENCQERRCGIINGKCLGCLPGWMGDECKEGSSLH